jgi:hypothetical protein
MFDYSSILLSKVILSGFQASLLAEAVDTADISADGGRGVIRVKSAEDTVKSGEM